MPARERYFEGDRPRPEGEPRRGGEQSAPVFTRKMGPLPVWAWGGIAVVGVLIFRRLQTGKATAAQGSGADPSTGLAYGVDPSTGFPYYSAAGGGVGGTFLLPPTGTTPAPASAPATTPPVPVPTLTPQEAAFEEYVARVGPTYPGGIPALTSALQTIGNLTPGQQAQLIAIGRR